MPPLSASVIVATFAAPTAVAEQFWNVPPRVIVGAPGSANAGLNVVVIVLPAASEPPALTVNAAVKFEVAAGVSGVPVNVTPVTAVALIVMFVAWFANVLSELVCTRKLAVAPAMYRPADGFTMLPSVIVAGVEIGSAHTPPEFASVTVITEPTAVPVALQFAKVGLSPTGSVAGIVNAAWNCTVIVPPAASAPVALEVKPTVHVVGVFARPVFAAEPVYVMAVGGAASAMRGVDVRMPAAPMMKARRTASGARSGRRGLRGRRGIRCVCLLSERRPFDHFAPESVPVQPAPHADTLQEPPR